jgi:SEC-C motif-containing protein
MTACPCGSGADLDQCCGPIITGTRPAPTAEALMRSRYTAFVRGNLDHIQNTYARAQREGVDLPAVKGMFGSVEWMGLEIFDTARGGEDDDTGTVDFAARFRRGGEARVHRERSNFHREEGRWVYVDGDVFATSGVGSAPWKVGRNQPCPCGSGKKFKFCCGR